ncbi:sensor histidine kinase [Arthrobacter sp. GMC3]|uniref:sensor histidine kinase n=1 Tax=Arthrobacter sp. GMC3 TaxID=2058894 RepID=UPI002158907E|nr:histidine kinase [Arthrobacter sp. GMC3]
MHPGYWGWSVVPGVLVFTVAIAVSARLPLVSLAIVALLLAGQVVDLVPPASSGLWTVNLAFAFALFFVAYNGGRWIRWAGLGLAPLYAGAMAFLLLSRKHGGGGYGFIMVSQWAGRQPMINYWAAGTALFLLVMLVFWLAGFLIRNHEERTILSKQREEAQSSRQAAEVDLVVEQERTRISRDLHDVLAHSLAVIVAQADGSRYISQDLPSPVQLALQDIAGSARKALVDAQRVIYSGHDDKLTEPQPGLHDVDTLIEQMDGSPLAVVRTVSGTPVDLAAGQELAVYRIVQESLTNALKHGGADAQASVHFDWSGPGLAVQVCNATKEPSAGQSPSGAPGMGRGIPGMSERARLAGGWLVAEPGEGEFLVNAFIPYGQALPSPAAPPLVSEKQESELLALGGATHD